MICKDELKKDFRSSVRSIQLQSLALMVLLSSLSIGCYAPLRSPAIAARCLPDSYRTPYRAVGKPLNFAVLTQEPQADYTLGPHDVLDVSVPELYRGAEIRPMQVQVMDSGEIVLPLIGPVKVGGMNLLEAQQEITKRFAAGTLKNPSVNVHLAERSTVDVLVLGEVGNSGIYSLPRFQNDVGHALASAGGLTERAADVIEVHRKRKQPRAGDPAMLGNPASKDNPELLPLPLIEPDVTLVRGRHKHVLRETTEDGTESVLRIPLRGLESGMLSQADITLQPGDVVRIPSRRNEVFWVVGKLSPNNLVRFTLGDRERELGAGLVLPPDRDIDVVTAVVMAGYIDPIDSPTTVTVQRKNPDGSPLLIRVDLIEARYDAKATILVEPGDIIYLNPDAAWWYRRTFDRIVPDVLLLPYAASVLKWFGR